MGLQSEKRRLDHKCCNWRLGHVFYLNGVSGLMPRNRGKAI